MDLLKPENGLLKYGIEVSEKKKSKIFKFVAGQKMADKDKSS